MGTGPENIPQATHFQSNLISIGLWDSSVAACSACRKFLIRFWPAPFAVLPKWKSSISPSSHLCNDETQNKFYKNQMQDSNHYSSIPCLISTYLVIFVLGSTENGASWHSKK